MTHDDDRFLVGLLRTETFGGIVVLAAAAVAVAWANLAGASYDALRDWQLGPLDLAHWAADGALSLFFYLAGLEVKRELLVGSLRRPTEALVPIVAACCGVAVPALVYTAVNLGGSHARGWAVPSATDIAFALAVLAVVGGAMPAAVRGFLLTLAVVDDLIVIVVIAVFYGATVHWLWLGGAALGLAAFWVLQRVRGESWLLYLPLAPATWWCMHESGIHATIAGVAMGLLTRVLPDADEAASPAERVEHALQPWSAAVAVPLFALTSAGVALDSLGRTVTDRAAAGIFLGLLLGKPLGIVGGSFLVTRLTPARLDPEMSWHDLVGLGILGGVGFTVALLVADLSFTDPGPAKTAVLAGSLASALLGAVVLRRRGSTYAGG